MKVILTDKVKTLGNLGEILSVTAGFARNFLFPRKLAVLADESHSKILENQKRALKKRIDSEKKRAEELGSKLKGLTLDFTRRVGANGKLFGTITTTELAKILHERGVDVERRLLHLDIPIKGLGTFDVKAKLFSGVEQIFKVKVVMDPAQAEEIKKREELARKRKEKKAQEDAEAPKDGAVEAKAADSAEDE